MTSILKNYKWKNEKWGYRVSIGKKEWEFTDTEFNELQKIIRVGYKKESKLSIFLRLAPYHVLWFFKFKFWALRSLYREMINHFNKKL